MEVFALANEGFAVPKAAKMRGKLKGTNVKPSAFFRWAALTAIEVAGIPGCPGLLPSGTEKIRKSVQKLNCQIRRDA